VLACNDDFLEAAIDDRRADAQGFGRGAFTTDELDVLDLVANGLTDHAIARRLTVSIVTVRRRATAFRNKVGARNRAEAIAIAAGFGWIVHPVVAAERARRAGGERE
jgi:DNA-binding NarL/FixJ family response regulator